jgi:glycosyltransferase involved in cell wall biosynthesis
MRRLKERLGLLVFVGAFAPLYALTRVLTLLLELLRWRRWWPRLQPHIGIRRRVLFLEPLYPEGSGYAYRVMHWMRVLEAAGYTARALHPLSRRTTEMLQSRGWTGLLLAVYLIRRLPQVLIAPFYSCVVVRRELLLYNDYGNLFLDRLLLALNPRIVLDFDDDISAAKREPRQLTAVGRLLRENPTKFGDSLRLYSSFIAGSEYLRKLALEERAGAPADIEVVPTCVDYSDMPAKSYDADSRLLTLGWIGTNGNLPELERIVPALDELADRVPLRLLVISGRDLGVGANFPVENRRWSLGTQISDLLEVDVGLMPLGDTRVDRGKCGFKLIQYMGLGIVSVASAVTTNREIVTDGVDGFLVEPGDSWLEALERAVDRRRDFPGIGSAARSTIQGAYSFEAHAPRYVNLIRRACDG